MEEITETYDPQWYDQWKSGTLREEWLAKYPWLAEYVSEARNQPEYHFGEWLTAIRYHKKGWKVLVEKYMFRKHKKLYGIAEKLVGKDEINIVQEQQGSGVRQAPDLLVYKDNGEYFFVEVKKNRDDLSQSQKEHFKRIEQELKCNVVIVNLIQRKGYLLDV